MNAPKQQQSFSSFLGSQSQSMQTLKSKRGIVPILKPKNKGFFLEQEQEATRI